MYKNIFKTSYTKGDKKIMLVAHVLPEVLLTISISALVGAGAYILKVYRDYNALKTSMLYRQEDMVLIFRCMRVLLETHASRPESSDSGQLAAITEELNRHIEKRAAGLGARDKV